MIVSLGMQDVLVTLFAFGAAVLMIRRLIGIVGPAASKPGCAHCPSPCPPSAAAAGTPTPPANVIWLAKTGNSPSRGKSFAAGASNSPRVR
jgi:hypothetical protein